MMPTLAPFNSKLLKPCKRILLTLLKFPYKKPISIRAFRFRNLRKVEEKSKKKKKWSIHRRKLKLARVFGSLLSRRRCWWWWWEEMDDNVGELRSTAPETAPFRAPFPSPLTPAYIKMMVGGRDEGGEECNEVEEACRSFENYLVEMIVEEGKVRDLMDVEELLQCWSSLKSPVFVDLVSRFYGELCKDLFLRKADYQVVVTDVDDDHHLL